MGKDWWLIEENTVAKMEKCMASVGGGYDEGGKTYFGMRSVGILAAFRLVIRVMNGIVARERGRNVEAQRYLGTGW